MKPIKKPQARKERRCPALFIWEGREWLGFSYGRFSEEGRQMYLCVKPDNPRVLLGVPRSRVKLISG